MLMVALRLFCPRMLLLAMLLLFSISARCAIAPPATPTPTVSTAIPDDDNRLSRTISLDDAGIPLDELLKKCSSKDLTLEVASSIAAQKVQVRLEQRPIATLMRCLAEMLPGYWEPLDNKAGYRLYMKASAQSRRDNWWALFLGERDKALAAQRAQILNTLRSEPYRRKPTDPDPEKSDRKIEEQRAKEHDVFRALPDALQERLARQINETPLYSGGGVGFGTDDEEGAIVVAASDLPLSAQTAIMARAAVINADANLATPSNTFVSLTNGGLALIGSIFLPDGRSTDAAFVLRVDPTPIFWSVMLNQQTLVAEAKRLGKKAPENWQRLVAYENSRVWRNDPPPFSNRSAIQRAEMLYWLGKDRHLEFVSDYYTVPGGLMDPEQRKELLAHPLEAELNFQTARQDASWRRDRDNIYLFRDNRWYRRDQLEVPADLLRRWWAMRRSEQKEQAEQRAKGITPSIAQRLKQQLDWEAEVVSTLTPWQISNGLSAYSPDLPPSGSVKPNTDELITPNNAEGNKFLYDMAMHPFQNDTERIMREYYTARFYAGLSEGQRTALLQQKLPFSSLTAEQRRQAQYLSPRLVMLVSNASSPVMLGLEYKTTSTITRNKVHLAVGFALP